MQPCAILRRVQESEKWGELLQAKKAIRMRWTYVQYSTCRELQYTLVENTDWYEATEYRENIH